MSAGLKPEGRKKLTKAAETQGCPKEFTPQGAPPSDDESVPTPNGPNCAAPEVGSLSAACQFAISACGFTAFTLMGRLR